MVKAVGIHKNYGSVDVLNGIDLHIKEGEVVAIIGASGAGKSTLLHILGTLDKASAGSVFIDDVDVSNMKVEQLAEFRNQKIGFVFQFHQLLPEFTALENVMMPALIALKSKKEAKEEAEKLLEFFGMGHRLEHKPSELSGGEKQRVAVARSLINNPSVIFADEPTGNLDTHNRDELHRLILQLREKFHQTFIVVSHDPQISKIADRTLHIVDGKIVERT